VSWSVPLIASMIVMCALLPIFGGSVLAVAAISKLVAVRTRSAPQGAA
jgi:hypothetical protein